MLGKVVDFYRALPPAERPASLTDEEAAKLTKKLRLQSFFAGTLGYSLYYVCRTGLNVVKTPIVESGMLNDNRSLHHIQPGEDSYCRERNAQRPTAGHRGLGVAVCLCHR